MKPRTFLDSKKNPGASDLTTPSALSPIDESTSDSELHPTASPTQAPKKKRKAKAPVSKTELAPSRSATRDTQEAPPIPESPQPIETRLTKNWGGGRQALSDIGLDFALIYKGELHRTLTGGILRKTALLDNLDFRTSIDADKLLGWKGGSAFIYVLANHGDQPSENVGDIQTTSNIETTTSWLKLYEFWIQQLFLEDKVSILVGLHDLNSEFYVTESSGLFFNSSFGIGKEISQTGAQGPSIFPVTSPALRIRAEPSKAFYVQWAAFGAVAGDPAEDNGTHYRFKLSDGQLLITEAAYLRGLEGSGELPAKYGIGTWSYTVPFDHQTSGEKTTSSGAYLLVNQAFSENGSTFLRYGVASAQANRIGSCFSTGVVLNGLIPGRSEDQFGLAMTVARNGDEYMSLQADSAVETSRSETVFELNYRIEALKGVAIQPSFQRIFHPDTNPLTPNASVFQTRLEINL